MAGRKRSLGSTPLWVLILIGAFVTAAGVYIQSSFQSTLSGMVAGTLAALGGGVVGAAISMLMSAGEGRDTLITVQGLLANSLKAQMRTAETDLRGIRHPWHYYHMTQRDGQFIWRYTNYRLDHSNAVGSIDLTITDVSFGREHVYRTEMALRGDRMILVDSSDDGSEPPIVSVTPFFTEGFRKVRAGVAFLRSWDGIDLLTKCLWSPTPLVESTSLDVPPEQGRTRDAMWEQAFRSANGVLPTIDAMSSPVATAHTGAGPPEQTGSST
jgi:hypothetical protein